ncbi:ferrous iron transport protein B [Vagococcus intermedius]|uniref:Ferrous iron transport protein B n=1 Tax=Vagococcus intermedius TaxID=2991418 RepID=A0AAF0CVB6_9ENTE|nr:ferrous iron transport protein B [Vagococcus intermedius]WEG73556.1 ferrous iron transport protein B [Vagococcus intermedius]WEG75638.1 ferrous iron transport protein B [Vagococcus intermedius]
MNKLSLALVGNPNSGKTSLFNALTGSSQSVGNWPGVTVERKEGYYKQADHIMIQDLPGIYSLSPYTPEEVVARNYLVEGQPEAIINIVDGSNLERNLYLTLQLLDLGLPLVVGVNMLDVVKKQEKEINLSKLSYGLGTDVVGMSVVKGQGVSEIVAKSLTAIESNNTSQRIGIQYDERLEVALLEIIGILHKATFQTEPTKKISENKYRWYSLKLFERDEAVCQTLVLSQADWKEIEEIITITEKIFGDDSESIVINERYQFITKLVELCVVNNKEFKLTVSDKIDQVVTNRFLALPIFAGLMWFVYYLSIQTIGTAGTDWLNDQLFGVLVPNYLAAGLNYLEVAEWLQRLILEGIVAGVGAVIGFLPQIMVLFLCLSFLEDCGYMSRLAFVMDRLFRKFGLSGKSFIPMLIATGCGVPGIMASRTIENEKDRKITIMVTTFMPCSAKLPIIALIAGALFPASSWVAPSAYFIGVLAIVFSGIMLKKTRGFRGDVAPFIMELPAYHWPQFQGVWQQTWHRSKAFVKKAGTLIFVSSILIWFSSNVNWQLHFVSEDQSILASLGSVLAYLFVPLGWGDWRSAVATITGLVAKENVVGTFGVLFGAGRDVSEAGQEIWPALQVIYTPVSGYSFLVFNLLCAPCFAAIGAIHREMSDYKWTLIAVLFQCGLAYAISFIIYQGGRILIEGQGITWLSIVAVGVLGSLIYSVMRPTKAEVVTLEDI